jgi:hypothetical protein
MILSATSATPAIGCIPTVREATIRADTFATAATTGLVTSATAATTVPTTTSST